MKISKESVLELLHSPENGRNSEGAFLTLNDGRILFAYTRFTSGGDFGDGHIAARYSSDNGKTWSEKDRILIENDALTTMSVSLVRLSQERIALFYLRKIDRINCQPQVRFSVDEGETWSAPTPITTAPGYYVLNNDRVLRYHDGRLLVPTGFHRVISDQAIGSRALDVIFYSDDQGKTWQESKNWILPPQFSTSGLHEPGLVQLFDRRIMGWARTDTGCQWVFFSSDRGESWSTARPAPEFLSPVSPMLVKRNPFEPALLYAVWNDHAPRYGLPDAQSTSWGRTPLVLAISRNDGETWEDHTIIEDAPDHGFCYPALHFLPDSLLLAYCCGTGSDVLNDLRIIRIQTTPSS